MVQHASDASDEASASSGIFRLFGKWDLINADGPNKGSLFVKLEHRHRIGAITPAALAGEVGYAGVTGVLFNDANLILNEFNWQHYLNEGKTGLVVGRFDPNDYMDVSGYKNPWTTFHNLASLFNTSIALPDTSWGVGMGHWFDNGTYILGTVNDANGSLTQQKAFEHGAEYFKQIGLGWTPARSLRYNNNIQLTYLESDAREHAGVPAGDGVAIHANWTFDDNWMLWTRLGWSDCLAPIYKESYSPGFA
jgi:porin